MPHIVKHERWKCISCGNCAAISPEFWEMDDEDYQANLKKSTVKTENVDGEDQKLFYLDIPEDKLEENEEAAESCPVECIHVLKKEVSAENSQELKIQSSEQV